MTLVEELRHAYMQTAGIPRLYGLAADEIERLGIALAERGTEIKRLQAALEKYGYHMPTCVVFKNECRNPPCDCGWDDVAKTLEEQAK